jgi:hypothetical protein
MLWRSKGNATQNISYWTHAQWRDTYPEVHGNRYQLRSEIPLFHLSHLEAHTICLRWVVNNIFISLFANIIHRRHFTFIATFLLAHINSTGFHCGNSTDTYNVL